MMYRRLREHTGIEISYYASGGEIAFVLRHSLPHLKPLLPLTIISFYGQFILIFLRSLLPS